MTAQFRSVVHRFFVSVVLALVASATANAATIHMRAWVNGAQVPLAVGGTGIGTVTFDTATKVLTWSITYQGLSGPCIAAHFHGPAPAGVNNVPVVTIPCSESPLTGSSAPLNATQEGWLLSGQLYINIHTGDHGGGEIRGQVLPVRWDFNGDGRSDVLWRNFSTGENYLYPLNGTAILASEGYLRTVSDQDWWVRGIADFNGDGKADILWRNESTGENYLYLMDGTAIAGEGYLRTVADLGWYVAGVGDFNGDGKADILWRNDGASAGQNYIYLMDGTTISGEGSIRTVPDVAWDVAGVADFDGDGRADILWRNETTGENYLYPMAGLTIRATEGYIRTVADVTWHVVAVADFDGDGRSDILWRNETSGENYLYPMDGTTILAGEGYVRQVADQNWQVMGLVSYDDDGGSSQPQLQLSFNYQHGTFGGGTTGLHDTPWPIASYFALFQSGFDPEVPPSVFFTGPMGSGLSNTESAARFMGTNSAGYSSPQRTEVPPGGLWTVNYEGVNLQFNLPDPDSTNRGILIVPTVTTDGDDLMQVSWQYKRADGSPVSPPQAYVTSVELRIDGLVAEQVVRLYGQQDIPFATTSHVLTSAVAWSQVTMIQMVMRDDRGNQYTSYWTKALPPAPSISNISPTSGPIASQVIITGVNFGCTGCVGGVNAVRFTGEGGAGPDGIAAQFTINSPTQITATVPAGTQPGPVWVQALGGESTSPQEFTPE